VTAAISRRRVRLHRAGRAQLADHLASSVRDRDLSCRLHPGAVLQSTTAGGQRQPGEARETSAPGSARMDRLHGRTIALPAREAMSSIDPGRRFRSDAPGLRRAPRTLRSWRDGSAVLWFLVCIACTACGSSPAAQQAGARVSHEPPVVLIGIDAADWLTIDRLVQKGSLPAFAQLKSSGRTGVMLSTPPLVSPIIWTTIATGAPPEKHGVFDFVVDTPGGVQQPVRSVDRRAPALWTLFSAYGQRVGVVGWWATWPAEHVRGTIVTDRLAPQLLQPHAGDDTGVVWPPEAVQRLRPLTLRPQQIGYDELARYIAINPAEYERAHSLLERHSDDIYEDKVAHLATIVASTHTYAAIAVDTLRRERPDLLAVYLEVVDSVSHLFVQEPRRGPSAIERAYRDADDLIAQVARASSPDTLIVVCSDHGFYPPTASVVEDADDLTGPATAWHRPYGIVAAAPAGILSGRKTKERFATGDAGTVSPLDIAPTVLHAAGLPVSREMPGRVMTGLLPPAATGRAVRRAEAPPTSRASQPPADATDTRQALARLKALGYVGSGRSTLGRQNLAEILYRRHDFAGAEREARAVLQLQPSNVTAMLWLAKALAEQSRPADALAVYERVLMLPGAARQALVEAVDLALAARQPDRARALIARAPQPADTAAAFAIAKGDVATASGEPALAERRYREALKIDPRSFDALARLTERLIAAGRRREAATLAESSTRLAPDSAQHVALLGEARLSAGDPAGAERALTRALQLAPDGTLIRVALARAQLIQGESSAALATLTPVPASSQRDTLVAAAHAARGDWPAAVKAFQLALEEGAATPELLNGLGWAHTKMGQREQALFAFKRSLGEKPDQPEIRKLVASLQRTE
jgi:predicted AlkP superfamily phosphohydrolase/phosphomutase/tetratricopeptide (TPR) repeat protein